MTDLTITLHLKKSNIINTYMTRNFLKHNLNKTKLFFVGKKVMFAK